MTRRDYCNECGGMVHDWDPICGECGASYHYDCHTLDDAHTRIYLMYSKCHTLSKKECNFTVKELKSFNEDIVTDEIEDIEEAQKLLIPLIEKYNNNADEDLLMDEDKSALYFILDIVSDKFVIDYFKCMKCNEKESMLLRITNLENELNALKNK